MELSMNISEDENCSFMTNNLLEQSENFDEWLDKNGVQFIINNERNTDNTNCINNPLDPLLNQIKIEKVSDSVAVVNKRSKHIITPKETGLNCGQPLVIPKFTTLSCKCNYLEELIRKGTVFVDFDLQETEIDVAFTNTKGFQIYPNVHINLNEVAGQLALPKERVPVLSMQIVGVAKDLKCVMACLNVGQSLKFYICPQIGCDCAYTRYTPAKLHILTKLKHKPFKCCYPDCTWAFYTIFKLKRHQDSHTNEKQFVCELKNCGRRFTSLYNLNTHIKKHDRLAVLPCLVKGCNMTFQTLKMRERHFRSHDESEAPFVCPETNCSRAFFLMIGLQSHSRSHSYKESDLRCDYPNCGKVFKQPCRLKEHLRLHTGTRPYVCDYEQCTWSFTSSSKLRRHQNTHKNDRKFHCTIGNCTKSFLRSEHLKEHTLTHIGPNIYSCEVCSESFYGFQGKTLLYLHIKKAHPELQQCVVLPFVQPSQELTQSDLPIDIKPTSEMLLEQAIQSLEVPSDMILGTGLIPEESLELLENGNFSTVNLRDLE